MSPALEWRMSTLEAEWLPPLVLGLLLAESRADEEAERLVGKTMLQLETVPPGQWTGHVLRAAVSLALWSDDSEAALSVAEREWPRALESDELAVIGWAASTCLEAAAAAAETARETSDTGLIVRAGALADLVLPAAEAHVAASSIGPQLGVRREAELWLATARAHAQRIRGRVDPAVWDGLASEWGALPMPYIEAKARWWQGLAALAAASENDREAARLAAREPLGEAFRIARDLPSLPLMRAVADLSSRARVGVAIIDEAVRAETASIADDVAAGEASAHGTLVRGLVAVGPGVARHIVVVPVGPGLPDADGPGSSHDIARAIEERVIASLRRGPSDAYGLSPREHEVLTIVAEGRTDREIAARLFISERTVHVHVRRVLAKLGVASRTEAAGLAIRQGLVPGAPDVTTGSVGARPSGGGMP